MNRVKGFTLIELLAVLAILAFILVIVIPKVVSVVSTTKINADSSTIKILNKATQLYRISNNIFDGDIFDGLTTDKARIELLISNKMLSNYDEPQQRDVAFKWSVEDQTWFMESTDEVELLSPYGNEFNEIAPAIINLMKDKFLENNRYGRTWSTYRYTDLGLDPADWSLPILHLFYVPNGSQLNVSVETGYVIKVKRLDGSDLNVIPAYNIIYETKNDNWYYYSVIPENIINVENLSTSS